MLRKLELDSLRADLAAVEGLLATRTSEEDPVGYFQYRKRREQLEKAIASMGQTPEHVASVGLFFAGDPVLGSKGIRSDFAGKVLEQFQTIVAKTHAALEGSMSGRRGPVPLRAESDLMVTDVVRGSVGFVLEEVEQSGELVNSKLKTVVETVARNVSAVASPDSETFEAVLEGMDWRLLGALGDFFALLDDNGAAVRIVESASDETLDQAAIRRARARTESVNVEDKESDDFVGRLFILPAERRFELDPGQGGQPIHGSVSSDYSADVLAQLTEAPDNPLTKTWRVRMRLLTIRRPNREPKTKYTLLGLIEDV